MDERDELIFAGDVKILTGKWPRELGLKPVMYGEIVRYRLEDALKHKKSPKNVGASFELHTTDLEV